MFQKTVKTFLPILWMFFIFWLSDKPLDYFPDGAPDYSQILIHIFLYAVLANLIVNAAAGINKRWEIKNIILFAISFSVLYGITDEYHQGFVPGRTVSFLDLGFDFLGAVLGAILPPPPAPPPLPRNRDGGKGGDKSPQPPFAKGGSKKLLLHVCCIGCGAYVARELKKDYCVVLSFYNPNIFPKNEYKKRLAEAERVAKKFKLKLIVGKYNHNAWLKLVKGFEKEPERGRRCLLCYRDRLNTAAKFAAKNGFDYFATTLTTSPHKDAEAISKIGQEMGRKYKIKFLDRDFKKQDGFKKSCELSKELGLYRQDYCGCEFSRSRI